MMKQIVRIGLAVMTALLALVLLWQFRIVVVYMLISLSFAAALRPLAARLSGKAAVVRAAWILLYLVILASFGLLLFFIIRTAIFEIQKLAQAFSGQAAWRLPLWFTGLSFQKALTAWLPTPGKLFDAVVYKQGKLNLPAILGFSENVGTVASGLLAILFLSIYWLINQIHFERLWLSLLPPNQRKQARGIWRTIETDLGVYLRGQVIQSLLAGLVLGLGYWALGSPYPAFLALTVILACLIPVIGPPFAVLPVFLVGMLAGWPLVLSTVLLTIVVLVAMAIWVKPRLFNRSYDNPILTLLIVLALASAFGLVGIMIAPPISGTCQILWSRLVSRRAVFGTAAQISSFKERHARLLETIKSMDTPPLPWVTSSMEQLSALIEKAEPLLQGVSPNAAFPGEQPDPALAPQPGKPEALPPAVTRT